MKSVQKQNAFVDLAAIKSVLFLSFCVLEGCSASRPYDVKEVSRESEICVASEISQVTFSSDYLKLNSLQKQRLILDLNVKSFNSDSNNGSIESLLSNEKFSPSVTMKLQMDPETAKRRMKQAFQRNCDVFPEAEANLPKQVHMLGSLAAIRFVIEAEGSQYTGLLSGTNSMPGIIRFSLAGPVKTKYSPKSDSKVDPDKFEFIPSIAVKLFFENRPSVDIVAIESLAGQKRQHNFFLMPLSNNFSDKSPMSHDHKVMERYAANSEAWEFTKNIHSMFRQTLDSLGHSKGEPMNRTVRNVASLERDGALISGEPKFPEKLVFKPNDALLVNHPAADSSPDEDFRYKLSLLSPGDIIYWIFAKDNDQEIKLGYLQLESVPLPSKFSDRQIFFRHSF